MSIFEDLKLEYIEDISDIRATIWIPVNSKKEFHEYKVRQVIDYFPRYRADNEIAKMNGKYGRLRKLSRKKNGNYVPVGPIGKCILNCLERQKPVIYPKNVKLNDLSKLLKDEWNYTDAEIKRLTPNRVSYLCIPLMNKNKSDILGVLYFDSSIENEIDSDFSNMAEYYLPRIANILVE